MNQPQLIVRDSLEQQTARQNLHDIEMLQKLPAFGRYIVEHQREQLKGLQELILETDAATITPEVREQSRILWLYVKKELERPDNDAREALKLLARK
jgi:hypothetical protein